jgi:hypothetical protein
MSKKANNNIHKATIKNIIDMINNGSTIDDIKRSIDLSDGELEWLDVIISEAESGKDASQIKDRIVQLKRQKKISKPTVDSDEEVVVMFSNGGTVEPMEPDTETAETNDEDDIVSQMECILSNFNDILPDDVLNNISETIGNRMPQFLHYINDKDKLSSMIMEAITDIVNEITLKSSKDGNVPKTDRIDSVVEPNFTLIAENPPAISSDGKVYEMLSIGDVNNKIKTSVEQLMSVVADILSSDNIDTMIKNGETKANIGERVLIKITNIGNNDPNTVYLCYDNNKRLCELIGKSISNYHITDDSDNDTKDFMILNATSEIMSIINDQTIIMTA